jgi:peptide/nickel transport system substrate-binding protein
LFISGTNVRKTTTSTHNGSTEVLQPRSNMSKLEIVDAARRGLSERENHIVDELQSGGINRRDFVKYASVAGMSIPLIGMFSGEVAAATKKAPAKRKPLLRVTTIAPGSKIDPVIANNGGALLMLGLAGEYLSYSNNQGVLEPRVAQSWKASADSTQWTFTIRKGIKFHNGKPLTADDVVATFDRLADPANKSNALSAFKGILEKGNTKKINANTVMFQLSQPVGAFPYIVSSDNYNSIILPADYAGDWEKTFIGCGPWVLEKYVVDQGATFKRNPNYWDKARQPNFDRLQVTQFKDDGARLAALQSGQSDWDAFSSATTATTLRNDPNFTVGQSPTAGHLQLHLRCDKGPFAADKRLRQAMLLTLDRPAIVAGVVDGYGTIGNDSPLAPLYPTTDKTVAQRKKDIAKAKSLMAAAGKADGFDVTLSTWGRADIKLYAQVVKQAAKEIGINVTIDIADDDGSAYYDDKRAPSWLNSDFGITEYGHRGVPNVYLNSALITGGVWNAAHYASAEFDTAAKALMASADLTVQKAQARKVQEILLEDSPIGFAYFGNALDVSKKVLTGNYTNGMNVLETTRAKLA